eukprot:794327-Amphidinium_carterae.1
MVASAAIVSADSVLLATQRERCERHSSGEHQESVVEVRALLVVRHISKPHWLRSPLAFEKEASLKPTSNH